MMLLLVSCSLENTIRWNVFNMTKGIYGIVSKFACILVFRIGHLVLAAGKLSHI